MSREWDLPRDAARLAEMKAEYDKPELLVVRDGKRICRACGYDWDTLVHGC